MKRGRNKVLIGLLVVVVGIQFIPASVNKQPEVLETDIRNVYKVPTEVLSILQTSCFDCHSNNTNYPWYSKIQPIRLIMDNHVENGKNKLNFSQFGSYFDRRMKNKLKSIANQIKDDAMPLGSYTLIHRKAVLQKEQKKTLIDWINKNLNNE